MSQNLQSASTMQTLAMQADHGAAQEHRMEQH